MTSHKDILNHKVHTGGWQSCMVEKLSHLTGGFMSLWGRYCTVRLRGCLDRTNFEFLKSTHQEVTYIITHSVLELWNQQVSWTSFNANLKDADLINISIPPTPHTFQLLLVHIDPYTNQLCIPGKSDMTRGPFQSRVSLYVEEDNQDAQIWKPRPFLHILFISA